MRNPIFLQKNFFRDVPKIFFRISRNLSESGSILSLPMLCNFVEAAEAAAASEAGLDDVDGNDNVDVDVDDVVEADSKESESTN